MDTIPALYDIHMTIFDSFTVITRRKVLETSIKRNFGTAGRISKCLTIIWGATKNATQWTPSHPSTTYIGWFLIVLWSFQVLRPWNFQSNVTLEPLVRFQSVLPLFGVPQKMLCNGHHPSPLGYTYDVLRSFLPRTLLPSPGITLMNPKSHEFDPRARRQSWRQKVNKKHSFFNNKGVGWYPLSCFSRGTQIWCKTLRNRPRNKEVRSIASQVSWVRVPDSAMKF